MKLLKGNPGKRKLNLEEPVYQPGSPEKPTWLNRDASGEWDRLVALLREGRVLTTADGGILLACCLAFSQLKANELAIHKYKSDVYKTTDQLGNILFKTRPEAVRREVARRQYVSFLSEIGQTPASRSKVRSLPPTTPGGVKRLLG
jgi:P27 family predicted phage terminase small subunit